MSLLSFIFLLCSLRTNLCFFLIFLCLSIGFGLLTGTYFQLNNGNVELAGRLQQGAGGAFFAACVFGWWIFVAIMLESLDFWWGVPGMYDPFEEEMGRLRR